MSPELSAIIYLLPGLAIVYLFQNRRKKLSQVSKENFPEIEEEGLHELTILLKTAYERMLYMGVGFFPLAYTSYVNGAMISKLFFFALILLLFFSNIPPRNKVMRFLENHELTIEDLQERGIKL